MWVLIGALLVLGVLLGLYGLGLWLITRWYRRALRRILAAHEAHCEQVSAECRADIERICGAADV